MQPLLDEKDRIIDKKDKKINELEEEIARLNGLLSTDGTNSGIPTSKTPINKNKVIPN
jgi:transposase